MCNVGFCAFKQQQVPIRLNVMPSGNDPVSVIAQVKKLRGIIDVICGASQQQISISEVVPMQNRLAIADLYVTGLSIWYSVSSSILLSLSGFSQGPMLVQPFAGVSGEFHNTIAW